MMDIYSFIIFILFLFPAYLIFIMIGNIWKFKKRFLTFIISYSILFFIFLVWDYYSLMFANLRYAENTTKIDFSKGKIVNYHYQTVDLQDFKYSFGILFDSTSFIEIEKQVNHQLDVCWEKSNKLYIYKEKCVNQTYPDFISAVIDCKTRRLSFAFAHI